MIRFCVAVCLISAALSGCSSSKGLYEWGDYEESLYDFTKKSDKLEDYREALLEAIEDGGAKNRVAPGLNAELGYLFLLDGNLATARQYFLVTWVANKVNKVARFFLETRDAWTAGGSDRVERRGA